MSLIDKKTIHHRADAKNYIEDYWTKRSPEFKKLRFGFLRDPSQQAGLRGYRNRPDRIHDCRRKGAGRGRAVPGAIFGYGCGEPAIS